MGHSGATPSLFTLAHVMGETTVHDQQPRLNLSQPKYSPFLLCFRVIKVKFMTNKTRPQTYLWVLCASAMALAACSSTQSSSNQGARLEASASSDLKANIEVKEIIRGKGCSGSFLKLFKTGDSKFLAQSGIDMATDEGKAKAAAAYDALYGSKGGEILTDIIVNPIYQTENKMSILGGEVCASVVGYRGVITSWDKVSK